MSDDHQNPLETEVRVKHAGHRSYALERQPTSIVRAVQALNSALDFYDTYWHSAGLLSETVHRVAKGLTVAYGLDLTQTPPPTSSERDLAATLASEGYAKSAEIDYEELKKLNNTVVFATRAGKGVVVPPGLADQFLHHCGLAPFHLLTKEEIEVDKHELAHLMRQAYEHPEHPDLVLPFGCIKLTAEDAQLALPWIQSAARDARMEFKGR